MLENCRNLTLPLISIAIMTNLRLGIEVLKVQEYLFEMQVPLASDWSLLIGRHSFAVLGIH